MPVLLASTPVILLRPAAIVAQEPMLQEPKTQLAALVLAAASPCKLSQLVPIAVLAITQLRPRLLAAWPAQQDHFRRQAPRLAQFALPAHLPINRPRPNV